VQRVHVELRYIKRSERTPAADTHAQSHSEGIIFERNTSEYRVKAYRLNKGGETKVRGQVRFSYTHAYKPSHINQLACSLCNGLLQRA
jgi:hypothetical protein